MHNLDLFSYTHIPHLRTIIYTYIFKNKLRSLCTRVVSSPTCMVVFMHAYMHALSCWHSCSHVDVLIYNSTFLFHGRYKGVSKNWAQHSCGQCTLSEAIRSECGNVFIYRHKRPNATEPCPTLEPIRTGCLNTTSEYNAFDWLLTSSWGSFGYFHVATNANLIETIH